MDRALEKVMGEAINGSRKAQSIADDLETMFEMWTGYMISRLGLEVFLNKLQTFDDMTFNLDGYQPTVMPVAMGMIANMTSIGLDLIKPSVAQIEDDSDTMLVEELKTISWLLFTIIEQGHPLKGLRYYVGLRDDEVALSIVDPAFTETYPDEDIHCGGMGTFIDKRERFLRMARPEIFE